MKKLFLLFTLYILSGITHSQSVTQGEVIPGVYRPIVVNSEGLLSASEYGVAVGFNDIIDVRRIVGLGHNPSIDSGTVPEDIWSGGGIYPWMTTATSLELVSSSAADAAAGTGATSVSVTCLTGSYVEQVQTVIPNGLTAVPLTNQCLRINSFSITGAGSGKINAGTLTVRDAGGGTVRAVMQIGYGIARQSNYTVPAGYTLQIISQYLGITSGTGAARVDSTTFTQSSLGFYRLPVTISASEGFPYRHDGIPGIVLGEKTDFIMRVTFSSGNGVAVSGAWIGYLKKN